jgi:uncharacterized secreted protein with C-terminal beta-propeller domain
MATICSLAKGNEAECHDELYLLVVSVDGEISQMLFDISNSQRPKEVEAVNLSLDGRLELAMERYVNLTAFWITYQQDVVFLSHVAT